MTTQEKLTDLLARSIYDPAFYIENILRPKPNPRWIWQKKFCNQIRDEMIKGKPKIKGLIRAAHGIGKTYIAAALTHWWAMTRPNSRVLTLAPTWAGVESHIWPNIAMVHAGSLLRDFGRMLTTQLVLGEPLSGGRPKWYAIGASSDHPENLEGHQSETAAMRVVDEAKAVEKDVFDATEGMLGAPENFDLWISTPSLATGEFYKRDTSNEDVIRLAIDIDQVIADGLTEKIAWKQDLLERWGEDSPKYQSRVMAKYIDNAEGALFPSSWVERAMAQTFEIEKPLVASLDCAGSVDGDESALAIIAGPNFQDRIHVHSIQAWQQRDTMVTKGKTLRILRECGAPSIRVDANGLGQGVADALREAGVIVDDYRSTNKANDPEDFFNRKAEDAWLLRGLFEKDLIRIPNIQTLKAQLVAMRYEVMPSGKIRIIDPEDSPDWVDALIMGCAAMRRGNLHYGRGDDRAISPADLRAF